jgi:hypothetical protein
LSTVSVEVSPWLPVTVTVVSAMVPTVWPFTVCSMPARTAYSPSAMLMAFPDVVHVGRPPGYLMSVETVMFERSGGDAGEVEACTALTGERCGAGGCW